MKHWARVVLGCILALALLPCSAVKAGGQAEPTADMVSSYLKYQEWHFELHLNDTQRAQYSALLRTDYAEGRLREDLAAAPAIVRKLAGSDWLDIAKFHSDQKQVDGIDRSTTEMLNNGSISGNGIWASTAGEAQRGYKSSAYMLRLVKAGDVPLVGSGNINDSLFQRQVDALFEWTAFRYTMVTGSSVGFDASEAGRKSFGQMLMANWRKAKGNPRLFAQLRGEVDLALWNWTVWRIADFGHFKRLSPFQQKEQLAQWAVELVPAMPWLKPAAERRIAELKAYAAKMPEAEVRAEYQRKMRSDAKFAATMKEMQAESAQLGQTVAQMRQSMVGFHVANLNTAENIGNSGYVWSVGRAN